jgi:hypothetical protein
MSKLLMPFLLVVVITSACSGGATTPEQVIQQGEQGTKPVVTIFRPPT